MAKRWVAPVWLVGLSISPFGFYGGIAFYAVPQLLASRHVAEARIAGLDGILILPLVLNVLFAPVLDVRFSRRWYATACCGLAAAFMWIALLNLGNLNVLGTLLFLGEIFLALFGAALGGWQASVVPTADQGMLSAWSNVGNIGAGGLMSIVSMRVIRHLPLPVASGLLAAMLLVPTIVFLFMPAPGPDRRLARESFSGLMRAVVSLFRRGEVILVLLLFVLPSASFTLTNILSGLGGDFHTPEATVSLINGVGITFAGIFASLAGGMLCARLPLRQLYLGIGVVGGLFTLSLLLVPHSVLGFGVATLGENALQALAFTVVVALSLRTVGHGNALAATEMSILGAAANIPLFYMQFIDSHALKLHGPAGAFATDAAISTTVCVALLGLLRYLRGRGTEDEEVSANRRTAAEINEREGCEGSGQAEVHLESNRQG
jgi:PAT family beta-lactamase induction signal transducer AmpG